MNNELSVLLHLLISYEYPLVIIVVFLGSIGLPIPSEAIIMASGSLTTGGKITPYILILIITSSAVSGDIVAYYLGKRYGYEVINHYGKLLGITTKKINKNHKFFTKWEGWAVFITRWLLTPLGMPISVLSGITKYPFRQYLIYCVSGELLWVSIYVWLGYLFGSNWISILGYMNYILGTVLFLAVALILIYLTFRIMKSHKHS